MVDIQSPTVEIRRGKKKEERRRKIETAGQKYNGLSAVLHRATIPRMLTINAPINNLTVARLEQFRSPQLHIQRERPTDVLVD